MGFYINPEDCTKEQWIEKHAIMVVAKDARRVFDERPPGYLPVVWLNNGSFTAAVVCDCMAEMERFLRPDDKRPKAVYYAAIDQLIPVVRPDLRQALPA